MTRGGVVAASDWSPQLFFVLVDDGAIVFGSNGSIRRNFGCEYFVAGPRDPSLSQIELYARFGGGFLSYPSQGGFKFSSKWKFSNLFIVQVPRSTFFFSSDLQGVTLRIFIFIFSLFFLKLFRFLNFSFFQTLKFSFSNFSNFHSQTLKFFVFQIFHFFQTFRFFQRQSSRAYARDSAFCHFIEIF